jgi:hypothetical protein
MKQGLENPAKLAKFFAIPRMQAGILTAHSNDIRFAKRNKSVTIWGIWHLTLPRILFQH